MDGVFINNWVQDVGVKREFSKERFWPSDNAFFFEISKGVICAGNVFINCDQGIYILNSSDAKVYNNTLINSTVTIGRTPRNPDNDRIFKWHSGTGPDVDERFGHVFINNLLTAHENYDRPFFVVWQTPSLCKRLNKPQLNQLDYNVYVRTSDEGSIPLMYWAPAKNKECRVEFESLEGLRKMHSNFAANSKSYVNYDGPLFKSWELVHPQLLQAFPASKVGAKLSADIRKLLGISEDDAPFVGAYPTNP